MHRATSMACAALGTAVLLFAPGAPAASYRSYDVTITQPKPDATVFSNPGDVDVQVGVKPELEGGDQLRLWLDETELTVRAADNAFHLKGVLRGRHEVVARVIDASRDVIGKSKPVTFYVWHASKLYPNRQGK
ncbi:MAG TPA: hypothetical protein VLT60_01335 [Usitatibacter sp.]|nr:hypothetical protein [Usitatibacter sp.]